jgi:hypothetical protein
MNLKLVPNKNFNMESKECLIKDDWINPTDWQVKPVVYAVVTGYYCAMKVTAETGRTV